MARTIGLSVGDLNVKLVPTLAERFCYSVPMAVPARPRGCNHVTYWSTVRDTEGDLNLTAFFIHSAQSQKDGAPHHRGAAAEPPEQRD